VAVEVAGLRAPVTFVSGNQINAQLPSLTITGPVGAKVSNVVDEVTGQPIGGAAPYLVRTIGSLKVGFIGLCLTSSEIRGDNLAGIRLVDPIAAAGQYLPRLEAEGADVIVAITHLTFEDDRALADRFPEIDLIIGGHEHEPIAATENRTLISKAGSQGRWVARIDVDRRANGSIERFYELLPVTGALSDDPQTAAVVRSYDDRLDKELDAVVGATSVPLDAESIRMRAGETNLGNLVADIIRADAGAELAIVNAGAIRGDRIYPAGPLTRRTLIDLHPFGNVICKVAVTGRLVLAALENGVSRLPSTSGGFPQISGMTMTVDPRGPPGSRVRDARVGAQPLDPERTYTLAIPDYLLKGGDDYSMFAGQRVLVSPEAGNLIQAAIEKHVASRRATSPAIDGRIVMLH